MATLAERMFDGFRAQSEIEEALFDINVEFDGTSFDSYDNSLELLDVPDNYRLSVEAQELIYNAGFSRVFLNHKDKWETHYTFKQGPFEGVRGWRVSYPQNRGKDAKGIWVEEIVDSWPKEWFETGYVVVKA